MTTLTIQPDNSTGQDTYVTDATPNTANGGAAMSIGTTAGFLLRGLLKFPLTGLPAHARILSATLSLWNANSVGSTVVYAANAVLGGNGNWSEASTWNHVVPATGERWAGDVAGDGGADAGCTVSGADYQPAAAGTWTYTASTASDTEHVIPLSPSVVQAWLDSGNDGLVLRHTSGSDAVAWWSCEASTAGFRPKLVIVYTLREQDTDVPNDLVVSVYNPDRTVCLGTLDGYDDLTATRGEFGMGTLTLKIPAEHPLFSLEFEKNSVTQTVRDWAMSEFGIRVEYHGTEFFDGTVVVFKDEDDGEGYGSPSTIHVECWDWRQWFLSARDIKGSGGARYSLTNRTVDNAIREVLRNNMVAGAVEPSWYSGNGIDREDFGSFTIAVEADSGLHGTSKALKWDNGQPLWDAVLEKCRTYGLWITGSWSGTTYTLGVAIAGGTDIHSTVVFSRERNGGLLKFSREVDRGGTSNVVEVRGRGRQGTGQTKVYAKNSASYADVGLRETGETHPSADGTSDAQENADFIMAQVGGAETHYTALVRETLDKQWPTFDVGDKVTIFDSRRAVTVNDWIVKLELMLTAPGPVELRITTGRAPTNADNNSGRSGGGRGGGRRAGGPPKRKDGDPVVDPDAILTFAQFEPDRGSNPVADVYNDSATVKKNLVANGGDMTYPNITILGTNDPERLLVAVMLLCETIRVKPYCWCPFELDTNSDGVPDKVVWLPAYELDESPGGPVTPPPVGP